MSAPTVGFVLGILGLAALVAVMATRQALREIAIERIFLVEWEHRLERREAALAEYARAVHEWEGRLSQIASCGCDLTEVCRRVPVEAQPHEPAA